MKKIVKPIEMIAYFDKDGNIRPARFRMDTASGKTLVIPIENIIRKDVEKLGGNRMLSFDCHSVIDDVEKSFQVKYELSTCRWYLYKI